MLAFTFVRLFPAQLLFEVHFIVDFIYAKIVLS